MSRFREFTITFRTDEYLCRDGYDLSLDDVLLELSLIDRDAFEGEPVDFVVWESDRVVAVVRIPCGEGSDPIITRFDNLPMSC